MSQENLIPISGDPFTPAEAVKVLRDRANSSYDVYHYMDRETDRHIADLIERLAAAKQEDPT